LGNHIATPANGRRDRYIGKQRLMRPGLRMLAGHGYTRSGQLTIAHEVARATTKGEAG